MHGDRWANVRLVNVKKAQLYNMEETYWLGKLRDI